MNCKEIHTDLIFYLGHELSAEKMEAIGRHLETCADCRRFAEMMERQLQLIDEEKNPEVSPFFYTRLSARLDEKSEPTRSLLPSWAQAAAFSIVLLVAISSGIYIGKQTSEIYGQKPGNSLLLIDDFEVEPIETFLLNQP